MSFNLKKLIVFVFTVNLFCLVCLAQDKSNKLTELFAEVREDERLVAECEQKAHEYQIAKFGRVLPKISGHCWDGCPTRIFLPFYPNEAKRLGISGQAKVETIVDEAGEVVYARAIAGQSFFRRAAEQAAYRSSYAPKKTCSDKAIKFRWMITYNFVLNP
jgi:TonB family protein